VRSAVLPGITRQAVIELAAVEGIEVKLESIDITGLLDADEIFVTNSIMQVMPVCRVERKAIGNDRPGEVTMRLAAGYQRLIDG
jgi:branched-subunit amino acid aminotransferase/4-amino-4-deoxychorismate lyase